MKISITEKINKIRQQLPEGVNLIAVTKKADIPAIREAYEAGIRDFAENRLQVALSKQEKLQDLTDICWHFIGHIQTNKAKKVVENFSWIHSVDSLKLARIINSYAQDFSNPPQVCLQVKVLPDTNKYGWKIAPLKQDLPELNKLAALNVQGLMTILPLGLSDSEILSAFESTRDLAQEIQEQNWTHLSMKHLSMGMSQDYLLAIKAGATMIRLGTIIFSESNLVE